MSRSTRTLLSEKKPGVTATHAAPGFFIRLAAQFYDALLLVAVLFVATALLLPFNNGQAASISQLQYYRIYLLLVSFLYYGWFWTHGGQTLGLKSWRLTVLTFDRQSITWKHAGYRFISAIPSWLCAGLGFIWILFDKDKRSWHDHLSKTAVFFDHSKSK